MQREQNILKRKHGGVLPDTAASTSDGTGGTTVTPAPTKRPRLYHVLREKEAEKQTSQYSNNNDNNNKPGAGSKRGTPVVVGGKHMKGGHESGNQNSFSSKHGSAGKDGGRAGFEGKKTGFLNAK